MTGTLPVMMASIGLWPRRTLVMQPPHLQLEEVVSSALERSPHINRRKLQVEAAAGRVVLRGVVGTYYQKQMAQEALRLVDGVDEIENQLEVAWS